MADHRQFEVECHLDRTTPGGRVLLLCTQDGVEVARLHRVFPSGAMLYRVSAPTPDDAAHLMAQHVPGLDPTLPLSLWEVADGGSTICWYFLNDDGTVRRHDD